MKHGGFCNNILLIGLREKALEKPCRGSDSAIFTSDFSGHWSALSQKNRFSGERFTEWGVIT